MTDFPIVRGFERKAEALLKDAQSRGEPVYGIKPWYCSANIIEKGAVVAFIGANPGGRPESEETDKELCVLDWPYRYATYNAWLDDRHWDGFGRAHQESVLGAFRILFGAQGEEILRNAACFNVVPLRTKRVNKLKKATWQSGTAWTMEVLEHVRPRLIVCNGSGVSRSAWGALLDSRQGLAKEQHKVQVQGTLMLKIGRIAHGEIAGAEVIGLPHMSRAKSLHNLRVAAAILGFPRSL